MRYIAIGLWPMLVILVLASLSFGRLLENDNVLADRGLSELLQK